MPRTIPTRPFLPIAAIGALILALVAVLGLRADGQPRAGPSAVKVGTASKATEAPPRRAAPRTVTLPKELPPSPQDPLGQFRQTLLSAYPDGFGGLKPAANGGFTVLEVGQPNTSLEQDARLAYAKVPLAFHEPATFVQPGLTFSIVAHSLHSLELARDAISDQLPTLLSVGIYGVGIDESHNQVVLLSTGTASSANAAQEITKKYGATMISVSVGPIPRTVANRYGDVPPWNAGDEIVAIGTGACTSGFGVHNQAGGVYLLTAGHCGDDAWYNTNFYAPNYNSADFIGDTQYGSVVLGGLDAQVIATSSSCISWGGLSTNDSNASRIYVTGNFDPPSGVPVQQEGSFSTEQVGQVTMAGISFYEYDPNNSTYYYITHGLRTSASGQPGDSGGPMIEPSYYGPLAIGIILAVDSTTTYGQQIGADLYSYAIQMNTLQRGCK